MPGLVLLFLVGMVLLVVLCGCGCDDEAEPDTDSADIPGELPPVASNDCGLAPGISTCRF